MSEMRSQRRLAAILVTDVVGFARLMEEDEAGTLSALKDLNQRILEPIIREHEGRIVKMMGDGMLVEFASAMNAVEAALQLQAGADAENEQVSEARRIRLRIGVNLGDVLGEGEDIFGEGVNVAARLEALAEPGGICVSDSVFQQVRRKLSAHFNDLGPVKLKNITEPVRIFATQTPGERFHQQRVVTDGQRRPVVLVLPFASQGDAVDRTYFSDGFTRDVITDLSRFNRLSVVWREKAFAPHDSSGDHLAIARSLGADYVVEGSIRKLADRIRLSVSLIATDGGTRLWSERKDFLGEELFTVHDDVVHQLVSTVDGRVSASRLDRARRKAPASLAAYEYVLLGDALPLLDENYREAQAFYEKALALDPEYPRAHSQLSYILSLQWFSAMDDRSDLLDRAFDYAKKAVFLDANDPDNLNSLGWIYLARRAFPQAIHYFRRAYELNPQDAWHNGYMAVLSSSLGESDTALNWLAKAQQLDRYFEPVWFCHVAGIAHFTAGRYAQAIEQLERSITMPFYVIAYLAAAAALDGRRDQAAQWAAQLLGVRPSFNREKFVAKEMLMRDADRSRLLNGLEAAGLP
jgi:class 3 adenylate cyclase/TolB-like protein/Tfp pilus assembly protein PilF